MFNELDVSLRISIAGAQSGTPQLAEMPEGQSSPLITFLKTVFSGEISSTSDTFGSHRLALSFPHLP